MCTIVAGVGHVVISSGRVRNNCPLTILVWYQITPQSRPSQEIFDKSIGFLPGLFDSKGLSDEVHRDLAKAVNLYKGSHLTAGIGSTLMK
jgi:hypothetical protein